MTLSELREALQDRQNQLNDAVANGLQLLQNNAAAEAMTENSARVENLRAQMATLRDAIANQEGQQRRQAGEQAPTDHQEGQSIRASREYARAFAYAVTHGLSVRDARNDTRCKPLLDAMTEAGGTPKGADGGFLVPEDLEFQIHQVRRAFTPLGDLVNRENVTAPTGWRIYSPEATQGFSLVAEMGTIGKVAQPTFTRIPFTVNKYADIVAVSNELSEDNVAGLYAYLANWFGRRLAITENGLVTGLLGTEVTPVAATQDYLAALKTVLNVTLDPAISASATILTNQTGLNILDQELDGNQRPLLQPDVTNPTQFRVLGRPLVVVSDAQMPNVSNAAPLYVGNFHDFATLFVRKGFTLDSSDVGGSAWSTDSIEYRGIVRMGIAAFDSAAVAGLTLS